MNFVVAAIMCTIFIMTSSFFPLKWKKLKKCSPYTILIRKIYYSTADYIGFRFLFVPTSTVSSRLKAVSFLPIINLYTVLVMGRKKKGPLYSWVTSALKAEWWRKFALNELITVKKRGQVYCPRVTCAERININLTLA